MQTVQARDVAALKLQHSVVHNCLGARHNTPPQRDIQRSGSLANHSHRIVKANRGNGVCQLRLVNQVFGCEIFEQLCNGLNTPPVFQIDNMNQFREEAISEISSRNSALMTWKVIAMQIFCDEEPAWLHHRPIAEKRTNDFAWNMRTVLDYYIEAWYKLRDFVARCRERCIIDQHLNSTIVVTQTGTTRINVTPNDVLRVFKILCPQLQTAPVLYANLQQAAKLLPSRTQNRIVK